MQTTQNFVELFLDSSEKYPEQIAIIEKNAETISYGELKIQVESRAAYLYKHGIRSGDRVLVCIPGSIDLYCNILALLYIGAISVLPENWNNKAGLDQSSKLCECKALIGIPKARLAAYFSKTLRKIPVKLEAKSPNFRSIFPLTKVFPDQAAIITFNSQANPNVLAEKRSHQFLFEQLHLLLDVMDPQLWEISLHTSPLMLLNFLSIGATSVIGNLKSSSPSSIDHDTLIQQLRLFKVNRLTCSPGVLKKISEQLIEKVQELPDIQSIYCVGSPVFQAVGRLFPEAFPQARINIAYGSSEANPIGVFTPKELLSEPESGKGVLVGNILAPTEVKIIEMIDVPIKLTNNLELESLKELPGEIGEIIVKGPQVLGAYYDNLPAFEKHKIVVGDELWHRTGDAGFLMHNKLYYAGKCSDIIHFKGEKYGPLLFEEYLKGIKQINIGTLFVLDDKLTLLVEVPKESDQAIVSKKLTHANLKFDQVVFLKHIPRDSQDIQKINYEQLEKLLLKKSPNSSSLNI